jgi:hypothetical protein
VKVSELAALDWQTTDSTNVARIAYDEDGSSMYVQYTGEGEPIYAYSGVSRQVVAAVLHAQSVGSMLRKLVTHPVRGQRYDYERVEVDPDDLDGTLPATDVTAALREIVVELRELNAHIGNVLTFIRGASRPRPQRREDAD